MIYVTVKLEMSYFGHCDIKTAFPKSGKIMISNIFLNHNPVAHMGQ